MASIKTLSTGKPVDLSIRGELSEIADSVNQASQVLSRQNQARAILGSPIPIDHYLYSAQKQDSLADSLSRTRPHPEWCTVSVFPLAIYQSIFSPFLCLLSFSCLSIFLRLP